MKFNEDRSFATPEAAEKKLLELANAIEADRAGRLSVGVVNTQFREAGGSSPSSKHSCARLPSEPSKQHGGASERSSKPLALKNAQTTLPTPGKLQREAIML